MLMLGGSSSRSGPGPGRFCGCFYVLLLAWRVDPSVDISWILEAPTPYDRSGIVSRYGPTVSRYTCENGVRLNYVLRRRVSSHSDVRFGTITIGSKRSIIRSTTLNRPAEPMLWDCTRHGRRSLCCAVPCSAAAAPRSAGLYTNRARLLPRRTGRGNSRSRRALRLSPSRGPPLLRGVRSYHCVPRTIAPSAGSDGTYT